MAATAAFTVMGCSLEKAVTTTETYTDADGNTITSTALADEDGNVKNGTRLVIMKSS